MCIHLLFLVDTFYVAVARAANTVFFACSCDDYNIAITKALNIKSKSYVSCVIYSVYLDFIFAIAFFRVLFFFFFFHFSTPFAWLPSSFMLALIARHCFTLILHSESPSLCFYHHIFLCLSVSLARTYNSTFFF